MQTKKSDLKTLETLKKRSDFLLMNAKGQKWVAKGLILQVKKQSPQKDKKGVGYTVSKRVDKSAVKRNRIKRRLRAVAADILPLFAKKHHDYVLIGKTLTATRPYEELKNDLKWCLKKLDCLNSQEHSEKET